MKPSYGDAFLDEMGVRPLDKAKLDATLNRQLPIQPVTLADCLHTWQDDARRERTEHGYTLPWIEMQTAIKRKLRRGQIIVIGARPGVGKSMAVLEIIRHNLLANPEATALLLTMEMHNEDVVERAVAISTGIDTWALRDQIASDNAPPAILYAKSNPWLSRAYVHDEPVHAEDLERVISDHGKPQIVVIDYLGLLDAKGDGEHERTSRAMRKCKEAATRGSGIMVIASQFKRSSDSSSIPEEYREPKMSDLRYSGQVEQDADYIFGLWREQPEPEADPFDATPQTVRINCLKDRHGPGKGVIAKLTQGKGGGIR